MPAGIREPYGWKNRSKRLFNPTRLKAQVTIHYPEDIMLIVLKKIDIGKIIISLVRGWLVEGVRECSNNSSSKFIQRANLRSISDRCSDIKIHFAVCLGAGNPGREDKAPRRSDYNLAIIVFIGAREVSHPAVDGCDDEILRPDRDPIRFMPVSWQSGGLNCLTDVEIRTA